MSKKHTSLISELRGKLKTCDSSHELSNIKSYYLGKNGILADEFIKLKSVKLSEKKELGMSLNIL